MSLPAPAAASGLAHRFQALSERFKRNAPLRPNMPASDCFKHQRTDRGRAEPMWGDLQEYAAFCGDLLDKASVLIRSSYRTDFAVEIKADGTPVTSVDRAVEALLREGIEARFPDHGIVGEEQEPRPANGPWSWVIDPIDGTKSWIAGRPSFTTLVALCFDNDPVLGVIDQAITRERWIGRRGNGTTLNGRTAFCRDVERLNKAVTSCNNPMRAFRQLGPGFERLGDSSLMTISGGDSYLVGLLTLGKVDVVIDAGLAPVDYCALIPVIEGAGGVVTDFGGRPLHMHSDGSFLAAATAALHAEALSALSPCDQEAGPVALAAGV